MTIYQNEAKEEVLSEVEGTLARIHEESQKQADAAAEQYEKASSVWNRAKLLEQAAGAALKAYRQSFNDEGPKIAMDSINTAPTRSYRS